MDELVEGVLSVRARLSPDDRPRGVVHALAAARDVLAVALHVSLLEVRCEPVHVLPDRRPAPDGQQRVLKMRVLVFACARMGAGKRGRESESKTEVKTDYFYIFILFLIVAS